MHSSIFNAMLIIESRACYDVVNQRSEKEWKTEFTGNLRVMIGNRATAVERRRREVLVEA